MNWLAIASADHVDIGRRDGFMQVCHGKGGPLRRLRPLDRVIYYSPTKTYGVKDGLMSFTAFGEVTGSAPYRHVTDTGFAPFRLDICWREADPVPVRPLLESLDLTRGKANWAYPFRFGLLPLSDADCLLLAQRMGVVLPFTEDRRPVPGTGESPQLQLL